jgi:predicted RNase H-like nuclease
LSHDVTRYHATSRSGARLDPRLKQYLKELLADARLDADVEALVRQFERDAAAMPVPLDPEIFAGLRRRLGL